MLPFTHSKCKHTHTAPGTKGPGSRGKHDVQRPKTRRQVQPARPNNTAIRAAEPPTGASAARRNSKHAANFPDGEALR